MEEAGDYNGQASEEIVENVTRKIAIVYAGS
jgi:hypothetical protein